MELYDFNHFENFFQLYLPVFDRPAVNIPLDIQESSPVSLGQQGVEEGIENTTEVVENS